MNTIAMPLSLQALVQLTWWFNGRADKKAKKENGHQENANTAEHAEELEMETQASKDGDIYFALFLTCEQIHIG